MWFLKIAYLNISFYFLAVVFLLTCLPALGSFVIILALILPKRMMLRYLRRAISWYGAVVIRIIPWPLVRLDYKDFSKNKTSVPYIFICNHRSASDPFLLGVLPYEVVQVVNIWPFRLPVFGMVAKIAGYLNVRELPFEIFLAKTLQLLKEGVSIAVFPEGTRSRDNSVAQFHSAIFRVAFEAKVPIVPLCITGNEKIPPVGSPYLRPGKIKIHRLEAVTWDKYRNFSPFKLKNYLREIIIKETALMDQKNV